MKKKVVLLLTMMSSVSAATVAICALQNDQLYQFAGAQGSVVYKHYNKIDPTDDQHGCHEFWVSCSDYSYSLTQPTGGTIVEGGNITDNPSFDWNGMNILDQRYLPSLNQEKAWGLKPVLDSSNQKISFGLYPQTVVDDTDTINALNALGSDSICEEIGGYYYYNGNFYQTANGDRRDSDSHFSNGETVQNGTKYWFLCEKIDWVIMSSSGTQYLVYSEKALHAGINWGYTNSDTYEQSQVREWLNGIGFFDGEGFLQTALTNSAQYVTNMSLTLDDGSSSLNDQVRLLTKGEASDSTYFANNNARKLAPTDWAAAHHACFKNGTTSFTRWWLCEANTDNTKNAWGVGLDGDVGNGGPKTASGSNDRAERPVITIDIKSE